MATTAIIEKTKMKLGYDKGSKLYSNLKLDATDQNIFDTAVIIGGLQTTPVIKVTKVVESSLENA